MSLNRRVYKLIVPEFIKNKRRQYAQFLTRRITLIRNGYYDMRELARHSCFLKAEGGRENRAAKLTFFYHKIEKGLALAHPRAGFGEQWIESQFLPLLNDYYLAHGYDRIVGACYRALKSYVDFSEKHSASSNKIIEIIENLLSRIEQPRSGEVGGVKAVTSAGIHRDCNVNFSQFANCRHSIRNFSRAFVDHELIEKAIGIAQRTPSVCNRQPWHVYAYSDADKIASVLKHQNGNSGFSENIQIILIVAGDLSAMFNSTERNEIWVDGGMFAMSLVYALHSLGLGTCCLNLCHNFNDEKKLKDFAKMAPHHRPVMMIAVGHLADEFMVAQSQRKQLHEILSWRNATSKNQVLNRSAKLVDECICG